MIDENVGELFFEFFVWDCLGCLFLGYYCGEVDSVLNVEIVFIIFLNMVMMLLVGEVIGISYEFILID